MAALDTRDRILDRARIVLALGGRPTIDDFARAAGVSRATFYRAFRSRTALLEALSRSPEPDSRDRILQAALEIVGASGLTALSMDELADRAGVSRATLYRIFPGKSALFTGLVHAYSPLDPVMEVLEANADQPPETVLPLVARTIHRAVYGMGQNRAGLLRTLLFEVSSLAPETEEAARNLISRVAGAMVAYIVTQMSAGRLRTMNPLLALQAFIGPIFFHMVTRQAAERVLGLELGGEEAMGQLAEAWLRSMRPEEKDDE